MFAHQQDKSALQYDTMEDIEDVLGKNWHNGINVFFCFLQKKRNALTSNDNWITYSLNSIFNKQ